MTSHPTPSGAQLLNALVCTAREEQPDDLQLAHTLAALGFVGTATATGTSAAAVMKAAAAQGGAASALGSSHAVSAASAVMGLEATSASGAATAAALGLPLALGKWFAIGLISGSAVLGAGAAIEGKFSDAPQSSERSDTNNAQRRSSSSLPHRGAPGSAPVGGHVTLGVSGQERIPTEAARTLQERIPTEAVQTLGAAQGGASLHGSPRGAFADPGAQARAQEEQQGEAGIRSPRSEQACRSEADCSASYADRVGSATPDPDAHSIREQVEAIERSRSALRAGNWAKTEQEALRYLRGFPAGVFVPEAQYLIMEAQLRRGDHAAARRAAAKLIARFPSSAQSIKARQVMNSR